MTISNPKEAMFKSLDDMCGFNDYRKTLNLTTNISEDIDYQKNFTSYYRVRRDYEWLKNFYDYLEKNKNNKDISFETILRDISDIEHSVRKTNKNKDGKAKTVDASFASKMLVTINPNHPVWDSRALHFLKIEIDETLEPKEKINHCVKTYERMEKEIAEFIKTSAGQECIALFDKTFPSCVDFSSHKKVDFYLWNLGK